MHAKYRRPEHNICRKVPPQAGLRSRAHRAPPHEQRGASAIEFALVFPLFFLIFYAIITYGLILVAQQSVTLAAAEGARAALRHAADDTARHSNARTAAVGDNSVAAWLGTQHLSFSPAQAAAPLPCPYATGPDPARCYSVTVSYPYQEHPLVPLLLGPAMGFAVPDELSSTAIVQID